MTPEQIAAENRKAAEGPMGWKEVDFLDCMREGQFQVYSIGGSVWTRFKIKNRIGRRVIFSPMTNPSDAHRLMMRMVKLGYCIRSEIQNYPGEKVRYSYCFWKPDCQAFLEEGETWMAALTMAANKAWEAREK